MKIECDKCLGTCYEEVGEERNGISGARPCRQCGGAGYVEVLDESLAFGNDWIHGNCDV